MFHDRQKVSLDTAGRDAYLDGVTEGSSPYEKESVFHHDWCRGWHLQAQEDAESQENDELALYHEERAEFHRLDGREARICLLGGAPHPADLGKAIGISPEDWEGRCYEIADAIVSAGLIEGRAAYGHFTGRVHPQSMFGGMLVVQHGWILRPDGLICDPTRWVFEKRPPYIFIGTDEDYDEGGNEFRLANLGSFPARGSSGPVFRLDLEKGVVAALRRMVCSEFPEDAELSPKQAWWIASLRRYVRGGTARPVFSALERAGHKAFIPIDNWKSVMTNKPADLA